MLLPTVKLLVLISIELSVVDTADIKVPWSGRITIVPPCALTIPVSWEVAFSEPRAVILPNSASPSPFIWKPVLPVTKPVDWMYSSALMPPAVILSADTLVMFELSTCKIVDMPDALISPSSSPMRALSFFCSASRF